MNRSDPILTTRSPDAAVRDPDPHARDRRPGATTIWRGAAATTLCILLTTGCASVSPKRIAREPVVVANHHPMCVQLVVSGGGKERFGGMEEITEKEYTASIRKMLIDSKVFDGICDDGRSGLRLDVAVFKGSQKVHHIMKYEQTIPTNWRLTDTRTRAVLFQERIDGTGIATDFSGASRTVHATERAIRDGIERGLRKLSEVKLPTTP